MRVLPLLFDDGGRLFGVGLSVRLRVPVLFEQAAVLLALLLFGDLHVLFVLKLAQSVL